MICLWMSPVAVIKAQDEVKSCDPCERYEYYKLLSKKATTIEQFDPLWAKAAPYRGECAEKVKQTKERVIKYSETTNIILYIVSGLLAANIVISHVRG